MEMLLWAPKATVHSYKNHDSMHISISKGPLKYGVYNSSKITGPQTTLYSLRCSGPGFRGVITKKNSARSPSGDSVLPSHCFITTWLPGTILFL